MLGFQKEKKKQPTYSQPVVVFSHKESLIVKLDLPPEPFKGTNPNTSRKVFS